MERITMSQREGDEFGLAETSQGESISQRDAAQKMGERKRWVGTLLKRMSKQGYAVVRTRAGGLAFFRTRWECVQLCVDVPDLMKSSWLVAVARLLSRSGRFGVVLVCEASTKRFAGLHA